MKGKLNQATHPGLIRILELMQDLAGPYEIDGMLEEVLQVALEITEADRGSLWLYDENEKILEMRLPEVAPPIRLAEGQGIAGKCLANDEIINVSDCYSDPRFSSDVDNKTGLRTVTLLSIPLVGFENSQVGVLQLLNKRSGPFDDQDELLAVVLAAQCAIALQRTRMIHTLVAKERLDEEVNIAKEIQLSTLPEYMPDIPGYSFSGGYIPSAQTGGDLFDLVELGEEVFILMGDATGHGFGPALSATQMQAMFRVAFRTGADLDQAFIHVNNQLVEDLPDNRFLTAFAGFLDYREHKVRYHSGGQGPILHFHAADKSCSWFKPTSFPVGIMEFETIEPAREMYLAPGDILAVISDGVYEYHDEHNAQFGEQGVQQVLQNFHGNSMDELKERLLQAVFEFGGAAEHLDDITVVLVARTGPADNSRSETITCSRDLAEIENIVAATERFFAAAGIDNSIRYQVDLVMEELFVNMVKYSTETSANIEIEMTAQGKGIEVSLTDFDVDRFDPTAQGQVDIEAPLEQRAAGGLGIYLALKIVDSISYNYQDRVSKITFAKNTEFE